MRPHLIALGLTFSLLAAAACTELKPETDDAGSSAGGTDGGGGGDAGSGMGGATGGDGMGGEGGSGGDGPVECPAVEDRERVVLDGSSTAVTIDEDTTWECDKIYVLKGEVYVGSKNPPASATLTVEPGTLVYAQNATPPTQMLVAEGSSLVAEGTADRPITFTADPDEGPRTDKSWRGLALVGGARTNVSGLALEDFADDDRAIYGGGSTASQAGSCGSLKYVRVQFAGAEAQGSPVTALTVAGCGSGTTLDFVQVHRSSDGLGVIGGAPVVTHAVVTGSTNSAFRYAGGFQGTMQYLVGQASDAGIIGDNDITASAAPVTAPTIHNATLVGTAPFATGASVGFRVQSGAGGVLRDSVVVAFKDFAFEIDGTASQALAESATGDTTLDFSNVLYFDTGCDGTCTPFPDGGDGFDESAYVAGKLNVEGDPGLVGASTFASDMVPSFVPTETRVRQTTSGRPVGDIVSESFRGAVDFGASGANDWTTDGDWLSFPDE